MTIFIKQRDKQSDADKKIDFLAAGSLVAAIAVLSLAAGYVATRISAERAYREKWQDYNDCGWA